MENLSENFNCVCACIFLPMLSPQLLLLLHLREKQKGTQKGKCTFEVLVTDHKSAHCFSTGTIEILGEKHLYHHFILFYLQYCIGFAIHQYASKADYIRVICICTANLGILLCLETCVFNYSGKQSNYAEDIRDMGSISGSGRSPGGGHSIPLQFSCLENLMDRRACQAAVLGIAKSRT